MSTEKSSPIGLHRVVSPKGVLPQAAEVVDPHAPLTDDEVRISVERLNLDAASFRQLYEAHDGDGDAVRQAVLEIIGRRGKMQNPVTGSGGMLIGTVDAVGPDSPLGLKPGQPVATLVSLTLTPLVITDGLRQWDGQSEQVPCEGHAILFARSIAAVLPEDMPSDMSLAVMDVCGAPAMTARLVEQLTASTGTAPSVVVLGAAGKSGSLSIAAARAAGASRTVGVVRDNTEADALNSAGIADTTAVADATDAVAVSTIVHEKLGAPADLTVVCVDAPGCEHGAILATRDGGAVIFFSMATSFSQAALGAEGLAADVHMVIGNGYTPNHAEYALDLLRRERGIRELFTQRLLSESA